MLRTRIVAAVLAVCLSGYAWGQTPEKVNFRRDVQPIFKQNCIGCHGPAKQMNGFRLDQRRYGLPNRIGANGARITPGKSESSSWSNVVRM
jgi:mono/diheme cytochrome c family protein